MREMKDSGIEWCDLIPQKWNVMPNKYIMVKKKKICKKHIDEDILSLTMNGVIVRNLDDGGKMPTTFDGYQYISSGNLLMCLFDYDVTPRCIGYVESDGITSPAYSQFVMINDNCPKYYYYYYLMVDNTKELLHLAKNLRHSFTEEQFGTIKAPVPPIKEQKKIACFLDEKCGEIDSLTTDIQEQITTLEEYKKSLITEVVTKGLDPNVEMKDSGIEWIGEVPRHWSVSKLGNFITLSDEKNYKPLEEVNLISLYTNRGVVQHADLESTTGNKAQNANGYKVVHKDNIVVNIILAWMGAMGISKYDGVTSPAYDVYEINKQKVNAHFCHYVLRTPAIAGECRKYGRGIMMMRWRTYSTEFKKIKMMLPPLEEQQQIADYLDSKCSEIDAIIQTKKEQIDTLTEYKKSLIYEYVTGKKEVPVNE